MSRRALFRRREVLVGGALSALAAAEAAARPYGAHGIATLSTGVWSPTSAQSAAFLARASGLSLTQKKAYDALITGLVNAGVWTKLDALYLFAVENETYARQNLVSSSYTLTKHGTLFWQPLVGYAGDGGTGYLSSGFVPSTAGGKFAANSASYGGVVRNNRTFGAQWAEIGAIDASAVVFDQIFPLHTDGKCYSALNTNSSLSVTNSSGTAKGCWVSSRTASNLTTLYQNGVSVGTSPVSTQYLANQQVLILARYSSPGNPGQHSADTLSCAFWGQGLTAQDAAALNSLLAPYATEPEMPVEAWTWFSNRVFLDSTFANIDVNATGAAGFNWYTKGFFGSPVPPASDVTVANNILTVNGSNSSTFYRARIATVGYLGGTSTIGRSFAPGGYFESTFAFDPSITTGDTTHGWPSFWLQDVDGLLAQTNATAGHFAELDVIENVPIGVGNTAVWMAVHDWTKGNGEQFGSNNGYNFTPGSILSGLIQTQQVRYGALWVPTGRNGGTGFMRRFVNNTRVPTSDFSYSIGGTASPPTTPSNPAGVFSISESGNYALIIDGGYQWPINVSRVAVWQ